MAVLAERLAHLPELAEVLGADAAGERLGVQPALGGYWFPRSGWLHPPAVCRAMAAHPGVTLQDRCGPLTLQATADGWAAIGTGGVVATADIAIICIGGNAAALDGLDWLPLQAIRGQTSYIPATAQTAALRAAFCHEGYIAPARGSTHCIGATFNLRDADTTLRARDHRYNLDALAAALPAWADWLQGLDSSSLDGRVGYRCASPDYLPLAGPVPDYPAFLQTFAALRQNARRPVAARGNYVPGLYLNTAHGSRGLSSAPLVAELLASMVCGEPLPVSREIQRALAPARFLVRGLGRNRL
jgi:tRNA 5-methylaminomethyl-2-thiouridine biosynthesis bifunctional protein